MSEKNESVADVPAEGNSADFFAQPAATTPAEPATSGSKTSWPWAAVAAAALVSGVAGFAIGQTNGFNHNPVGVMQQIGGMHQPGNGMMGHGFSGQDMRGQMGDNDGPLDGMTAHCHDADGMDVTVGTDGKCADGTTPIAPMQGQMMDGHMRGGHYGDGKFAPGVTPTPITSQSSTTN